MASFNGGTPVTRGEVRQVRELKRGIQAHVCLGASVQHGSAVVVVETASPRVLKALEELKAAVRDDALALYQAIQADIPEPRMAGV